MNDALNSHPGDPETLEALTIRAGEARDLPALTSLLNHYIRESHVSFDLEPHTLESRRHWFQRFGETGPHRLLVAVEGGELLGLAYSQALRPKGGYDRSVETSIYLAQGMLGRGLGGALYDTLLTALAAEEVHRAYAGIALPNPASLALHKRRGFQPVGLFHEIGFKFGQYWDVQWLEKQL